MKNILPDHRGVVSGVLNLSRNLGLITGASVMGAVFAFTSGTTEIIKANPKAVAGGMRVTFAVAALLIVLAIAVGIVSCALAKRLLLQNKKLEVALSPPAR